MYNGLQVTWSRRFTAGSLFNVAYTFSKSMDNSSNYRDIVPDTYNTSNLWGPSEYDVRHVVIINYLYDLPFFKNHDHFDRKTARRLGAQRSHAVPDRERPAASEPTTISPASAQPISAVSDADPKASSGFLMERPAIVGGFAGPTGNASSVKYFTANVTPPPAGTFNLQTRGAGLRLPTGLAGLEYVVVQAVCHQ